MRWLCTRNAIADLNYVETCYNVYFYRELIYLKAPR